MRYLVTRRRAPAALAEAALASLMLAGCGRLTPAGGSETMTLLRSGSEKICVAPDVQKTLEKMIIPEPADIDGNEDANEKLGAISDIKLSYGVTTLQGFDKTVAKASCSSVITVADDENNSDKFNVDYQVSPSANASGEFVVSMASQAPKQYALDRVSYLLAQANRVQQAEIDEQTSKAAQAKLLATITPKWFVGTWITTGADAATCSDQRALTILPNHVFESNGATGRWMLDGDQLHFAGNGPDGAIDDLNTITEADAISFSATTKDNNSLSWRRCARAETQPPGTFERVPAPDAAPSANPNQSGAL